MCKLNYTKFITVCFSFLPKTKMLSLNLFLFLVTNVIWEVKNCRLIEPLSTREVNSPRCFIINHPRATSEVPNNYAALNMLFNLVEL